MSKPTENDRDFQNLVLGTILAAIAAVLLVTAIILVVRDDPWALAPVTGLVILWEIGKGEETPKERGLRAANERPLRLQQQNRRMR